MDRLHNYICLGTGQQRPIFTLADVLNFHFMSKESWRPNLSGNNLPAVHIYVPLKTIRDSFRVPLITQYNSLTSVILIHFQLALL